MRPSTTSCFCSLIILACTGGSETGNPVAPKKAEFQLYSSDPNSVSLTSGDGGTVIKEAWFPFNEIEFISDVECEELDDWNYQPGASYVVTELVSGGIGADLEVPYGDYCGVIVPFGTGFPELTDDIPSELQNRGFIVKGERADGVPFIINYPEPDEIELIAVQSTFTIDSSTDNLTFVFDVSIWMQDINLYNAAIGADNSIIINELSNFIILELIERNIRCSLLLFIDTNENGRPDQDEEILAQCPSGL